MSRLLVKNQQEPEDLRNGEHFSFWDGFTSERGEMKCTEAPKRLSRAALLHISQTSEPPEVLGLDDPVTFQCFSSSDTKSDTKS